MVDLRSIRDPEERGALVCASSALCVAAEPFVAVGDPDDGDVILPPLHLWGGSPGGRAWAEETLRGNLVPLTRPPFMTPVYAQPRILWATASQ
jgi:hypothetical protein